MATYIATYGLWLLFLVVAAESAGIPLPGETALISASILAAQGRLNIAAVITVAAAAAVLGDNFGYWAGRYWGRAVLRRWRLTRAYAGRMLPATEAFFARHGSKAVFLARFLTGLRVAAAWAAGIGRMQWRHFFLWNTLGGVTWAVGIGLASYYLGRWASGALERYGLYVALAVATVFGLIVTGRVLTYARRSRTSGGRRGDANTMGAS